MPRRYLDRRTEAEIEALLERERIAREQAAEAAQPGKPARPEPGKRGTMRRGVGDWQGLVEQRILEGMDQGLFDNLQGTGKPLNLDDDRFVPDELKLAFRLLRSSEVAPLWVELNKEIRDDIARMERFRATVHRNWQRISAIERDHRRIEYLRRIKEINSKILSYNIIAPSAQVHIGLLLADEELARFDNPEQAA